MPFPSLLAPQDIRAPYVLLDARAGSEVFLQDHLPGALHADLDLCLGDGHAPGADPARGGRHPLPSPEAWARQLGTWGITPGTPVVAYDDACGAAGAARLWWMLRAFGHEASAVLDGGIQAAKAVELPAPLPLTPAAPYPEDRWLLPQVDLAIVDRLRTDPDWKILDVRSAPRYRGETEPFDPVAGHIPGALNLFYQDNLGPDGR
jgi:thiosulfate/3-mercaptopyruvate sulfurtransferase